MTHGLRVMLLLLGLVCVVIGAIGIVVPLLPTTPFLLIAVFAFARSSEKLHRWIIGHPRLGTLIDNWHRYGGIDRQSKQIAMVVILATPVITLLHGAPNWVMALQLVILAVAAGFILTRPTPPKDKPMETKEQG